jgi:heat shock protein HslJ
MDGSTVNTPAPRPEPVSGGVRHAARTEAHDVVATVMDRACTDNMSGMPYPNTVTVVVDGKEYRGCGGEPVALLRGKEWVVEDIDRGGIIDRSRVTLNFDEKNRVFGRGCNTHNGVTRYRRGPDGDQPASTLMACAESPDSRQRFLEIPGSVERFELSETGALILHAAKGRTITARRRCGLRGLRTHVRGPSLAQSRPPRDQVVADFFSLNAPRTRRMPNTVA